MATVGYYRMREQHCRAMAKACNDPAIRHIHEELADRYSRQAEKTERANASEAVHFCRVYGALAGGS